MLVDRNRRMRQTAVLPASGNHQSSWTSNRLDATILDMNTHRFPFTSLQELITATFVAAGCEPREAAVVADHLVQANLTGHDSHGVIRTPIYVRWLQQGNVRTNQRLMVIFENDA